MITSSVFRGSASLCVELGRCCRRGRETASGRMEKSAVLAPVPKQKVSIVEREGPGWTVWLDSQGDGDCPICGTGPNSRHGSYVRPLRDLPAQGTSVLIQATRRVAGSPRAPRFTCHKMGCGAIGMPRRASLGDVACAVARPHEEEWEKSAVLVPVPKQKVSIVEREGSWLDRLVGQPRRRGLSNLWYGAQFPARLICPAASGPAGARDVGLDPGHAKGRRPAPGATLHMSQNGMWGDRHAQAGQRPSSTQSEAEPH
jgi:hypothetical protein